MSASGELIVQTATLGLELIDELTNGSLVGTSSVTVSLVSIPGLVITPTMFLVGRSRWVLENLDPTEEVQLAIEANGYFSETLQTNQSAPTLADPGGVPVPSVASPPSLVQVRLRPRSGYPFPGSLTRVAGSVLLAGAPVVGATVTVTPRFVDPVDDTTTDPGTPFDTLTADDGQFVAWLFPDVTQDHPTPVEFDVTATFGAHTQSLLEQPLLPQVVNGVTLALS
jgi:hypothetical protein